MERDIGTYVSDSETNSKIKNFFAQQRKKPVKFRTQINRNNYLIQLVDGGEINFNSFNDIDFKRSILRNYDYRGLRVGPGKNGFIPLDDCEPGRINFTLMHLYKTALNRRERFFR